MDNCELELMRSPTEFGWQAVVREPGVKLLPAYEDENGREC